MFKGKFVVLSLIAAALLCWQMMPADVNSGVVYPDSCLATTPGPGPYCLMVCPQGDGPTLIAVGATISVTVRDNTGTPLVGILATDFWLEGASSGNALCGGSGCIDAEAATDANGQTTIEDAWAAGGYDTGVKVVCQGVLLNQTLNITAVSPDMDGDLAVGLLDFSAFALAYPPNPYDPKADFDCTGAVNLLDFSLFAQHYNHSC
jgi:hypothetical protein